eukprot:6231931-Prymnesium_polylepis.1
MKALVASLHGTANLTLAVITSKDLIKADGMWIASCYTTPSYASTLERHRRRCCRQRHRAHGSR